nr:hypothetical protein [uncultured Microbacterium sp.]
MEHAPETPAIDRGLPRRTVLTGAAWTIPVIATAAIAPAASASGTLALAFNQATYTGTACSTITGAYVTATTNGAAAAGVPVTVTLSNGYTFAGGSTSYTGSSDGSGRVSLPAISVPSIGGTGTLSAISGAATSSANATSSPAPTTVTYYSWAGVAGVPTTSTITDVATSAGGGAGDHWAFALTSDGTLYASLNGSTFTANTTNVTHLNASDGAGIWSKSNNTVTYYGHTDVAGIPTTSTITDVATSAGGGAGDHWAFALTSDGTLYASLNGSTFTANTTNVTHLNASDGAAVYTTSKSC